MYTANGRVNPFSPGGDQKTGYHPNVARRRGNDLVSYLVQDQPGPSPSRDDYNERKRQEEENRRRSEEAARAREAEEARRRAEEDARRRADEEARRRADEEARRRAEEEAKKPDSFFRPDPTSDPANDYNNVNVVRGDTVDITSTNSDGRANQNAYVDNSVSTTIGDENVFGNNQTIGEGYAKTDINQIAQDFLAKRRGGINFRQDVNVDNSVETKVGDRNTFGDGLRLGNNYAKTDINQDATYSLNFGDLKNPSGGQARERSRNWLKTRS